MKVKFFNAWFVFVIVLNETFFCIDLGAQAITNDGLALTISSGLTMTFAGDFTNKNSGTIANSGAIEITGNWTNNSTGNVFSSSGGSVKFNGTGIQTIGGATATTFYDFTINNSSGAQLASDMNISDSLLMTSGNLNLANYIVTLGISTVTPGKLIYTGGWLYGGTFKRWFNTSVVANGSSAGLFPVGSSADY